jgi:hypothetical protein
VLLGAFEDLLSFGDERGLGPGVSESTAACAVIVILCDSRPEISNAPSSPAATCAFSVLK